MNPKARVLRRALGPFDFTPFPGTAGTDEAGQIAGRKAKSTMSYYPQHLIEIHQADKLRLAYEYALQNGCLDDFAKSFMGLLGFTSSYYKEAGEAERDLYVNIGYDGCLHSFRFWIASRKPGQNPNTIGRENGFIMNGGLIYHGPRDTGSGEGPTFTANLSRLTAGSDRPKHDWSIHT